MRELLASRSDSDGDTGRREPEATVEPAPPGAIRSTFLLTLAEILLNLVLAGQNRFLAMQIGPAGFGVYGLLQSIFRFVSSFSSTWLSVPATKWMAEYDADGDSQRRDNTFSLSLTLTLAILIPASIGFAVFHRPIIDTFMNGDVRVLHFFIFIAFAAFTAVRTVQSAILQGLLLIKRIVQIRVVTALGQLALIAALVPLFKLTGLFTALVVGLTVATTLAFWVMRADGQLRFVRPRPRSLESRRLLEFGGANLALMFVALGTEYAQRFIVLRALGIESVGFMVAAIQIVTYMDVANRSAMFYWLRSLEPSSRAEEHTVQPMAPLELSLVRELSTESAFALAAVLQHDNLTAPQLATVIDTDRIDALMELDILWNLNFLEHDTSSGQYRINPVALKPVCAMLEGRNLLY